MVVCVRQSVREQGRSGMYLVMVPRSEEALEQIQVQYIAFASLT